MGKAEPLQKYKIDTEKKRCFKNILYYYFAWTTDKQKFWLASDLLRTMLFVWEKNVKKIRERVEDNIL